MRPRGNVLMLLIPSTSGRMLIISRFPFNRILSMTHIVLTRWPLLRFIWGHMGLNWPFPVTLIYNIYQDRALFIYRRRIGTGDGPNVFPSQRHIDWCATWPFDSPRYCTWPRRGVKFRTFELLTSTCIYFDASRREEHDGARLCH